mgnify:CR=1 FL=1
MDIKEILKHVDHTLLLQGSTWEEIKQICDDAMKYETASACIAPSYVKEAAEYMNGRIPVCTVIGFPNGYMTTAAKEFETKDALANGASEIDMVINIGWLKDKKYDLIENEIKILKAACGDKILKVIIETCFLTDEEKIKMCEIVTSAGADYIKTSTGFGGAGATFADIELFAKHIGPNVKMKAAGGISSIDDALEDLEEELLTITDENDIGIQIQSLRRQYMLMKKSILPLKEQYVKLLRAENLLIHKVNRAFFNDVNDHLQFVLQTIEICRETLSSLVDLYISNNDLRMNDIMKRLTIVSTIFIPLTFLVGVWGMNYKWMPELDWRYGYLFAWILMGVIGIVVYLYFRKKKWY